MISYLLNKMKKISKRKKHVVSHFFELITPQINNNVQKILLLIYY